MLVAVIDWRWRKVPNALLLLLLLPASALMIWQGQGLLGVSVWPSVAGLVLAMAMLMPGYLASKLGAGDVKLAAVMGFVQGWAEVLWTLLAAALMLGVLTLLALLLLERHRLRTLRIPAAVALSCGFSAVLLVRIFANG